MGMSENFDILIVDDEERVCGVLMDLFSSQGYKTRMACNGDVALRRISEKIPDLVISDIQMPIMDGFTLFGILERTYPQIKHILMTSYDVDQYISLVRKYNIGNILIKGSEFSFNEVSSYVRSILCGDIFGLNRHFPGNPIQNVSVNSYIQAKKICSEIISQYPDKKSMFLEIAIDELVSNAFFHAILKLSDVPRERWPEYFEVRPECAIRVSWACDEEKIGVSVEDPRGNLKKTDVLKWLDSRREELEEEHGRGFLLVRKLIDRLIINIDPGKRTECVVIQYFNANPHNKPLMIHEL